MFKVERDGNTFELIAGPIGAVLRTTAPGEKPRVIDLEGRFPLNLYNRLKEATDPKSFRYGGSPLRLPRLPEVPSLMVVPRQLEDGRWIGLHWHEQIGKETTRFEISLRPSELEKLVRYMDENMTC
jgi:hypothetical protein